MALSDIKSPGRYSANLYTITRRFLDAHLGESWAKVYSQLCKTADVNTYLGHELRRHIQREVDDNVRARIRKPYSYADWFVDINGLLQKYPETESWKQRWRNRKNTAPIDRICFEGDGPDTYYELLEVPDGPRASKYTKMHKVWHRVVRTVRIVSYPVKPEQAAAMSIGLKKGKKDYYKEYSEESFHKQQVGHKLLSRLREVAARRVKFTKLTYGNLRDEKGLTAYVAGKST